MSEHQSTGASLSAGHLSLLLQNVSTLSNARNWRPPCGLKASSVACLPCSGMGTAIMQEPHGLLAPEWENTVLYYYVYLHLS